MKALLIGEDRQVSVKDHPVPAINDDEILVKVQAVSLNPSDWKHAAWAGNPGSVLGCDFSGTVVQAGKNVRVPRLGDHVAGFEQGGKEAERGAFAEYIKIAADLVWIVPPGTLTHEQAASISLVYVTHRTSIYSSSLTSLLLVRAASRLAFTLCHPTSLGLVEPPQQVPESEWILVYGGSSAVGQASIQLAHASGYKEVSTSSPRNFEVVRACGADAVFDYNDPDVVAQIKSATGNSLTKALDAISEESSQRIAAQSLGPSGGQLAIVLPPQPAAVGRDDVEFKFTFITTALGRAFVHMNKQFDAVTEDKAQLTEFYQSKLPGLVQSGVVRPLPLKLWDGGLERIHEGLQYMREGRVSAQKIVYKIAQE